jgi:TIR domain-containing protein
VQQALIEKVEILQNILVSRAQHKHQEIDDEEYPRRREELLSIQGVAERLPRFVRTCRSLSEFWDFIKANDLPSYQSRRVFIRGQFQQVLAYLEADQTLFAKDSVTSQADENRSTGETSLPGLSTPTRPLSGAGQAYVLPDPVLAKSLPGTEQTSGPIEIFFSYAHEDAELMHEVRRQFVIFERQGLITKWWDRMIPAGALWKEEIDVHLRQARIVLLFVSSHFFESDYCYEAEMQEALARHQNGHAVVVPIILRPCAWQKAPFGHLQALPTDGKPITTWGDRDQACLNVAEGVMDIVRDIS